MSTIIMSRCVFLGLLLLIQAETIKADMLIDLIESEGYKVERHEVITDDNYVLGLYRIPSPKRNAKTVFYMHALFVTAMDCFLFGPKYSLCYMLADENFDVWVGNARGTKFSYKHQLLDARNSSAFWDYSFHEIGKYDLPAMIDYALLVTNRTALHYVGYSQGCTTFLVMLALRPEYNAKIASMNALAPAAFLGEFDYYQYKQLVGDATFVKPYLDLFGIHELSRNGFPFADLVLPFINRICPDFSLAQILCVNTYFWFGNSNVPLFSLKSAYYLYHNVPAAISAKQLQHYVQLVTSGNFQEYDYGLERNREVYKGQDAPPMYNLSAVTADVYVMYGSKDVITPAVGVKQLIEILGSSVKMDNQIEGFNHVDFGYSRFANDVVYKQILKNIGKY